jgi:hypothetical protein
MLDDLTSNPPCLWQLVSSKRRILITRLLESRRDNEVEDVI